MTHVRRHLRNLVVVMVPLMLLAAMAYGPGVALAGGSDTVAEAQEDFADAVADANEELQKALADAQAEFAEAIADAREELAEELADL